MRTAPVRFEDVVSFGNLERAARAAIRGKTRTAAADELLFHLEPEVLRLLDALRAGTWRPGTFRVFTVYEPKQRRIAAAPLADRVVHHAVCNLLGPHFERWSIAHSYACRVGKGTHRAVRRAHALCRRHRYFLKADVSKFFDSVDHATLKCMLAARFEDQRLLGLLALIVDHAPPGNPPGKGIPIGNLTSQHFANFYLGPLDRALAARCGERHYLRYMDDFLVFADDKPTLHEARALAGQVLGDELKLSLKEPATFVAPCSEGVPFLGLRLFPGTVRLAHRNAVRFRRTWRTRLAELRRGERSWPSFLASAQSLVGYLGHANTFHLREGVFDASQG